MPVSNGLSSGTALVAGGAVGTDDGSAPGARGLTLGASFGASAVGAASFGFLALSGLGAGVLGPGAFGAGFTLGLVFSAGFFGFLTFSCPAGTSGTGGAG